MNLLKQINNMEEFLKIIADSAKQISVVHNHRVTFFDESHLFDFRDNTYEGEMNQRFIDMFKQGSGSELSLKACATHSSSMLSYNFFHLINSDCTFEDPIDRVVYDKVYFEVQLPTLMNSTPANMDVVLTGKEIGVPNRKVICFIESKFTEYLTTAKTELGQMRNNSYSKFNSKLEYIGDNYFHREEWKKLISESYPINKRAKGYYDGIKQEICHLIAISNLRDEKGREAYRSLKRTCEYPYIEGKERFIFKNILLKAQTEYDPDDMFGIYERLYGELKSKFTNIRPDADIEMSLTTYSDIWDSLKKKYPEAIQEYLYKRYLTFARKQFE